MKIIDEVVKEPTGGADRIKEQVVSSTREILVKYLNEFKQYSGEEILKERKEKFLSIGKQKAFTVFSKESKWISRDNFFIFVKKILLKLKKELIITFLLKFFNL